MKKLIYISLIFIVLIACEKERQEVMVKYEISNAYSPVEVNYRNSDGNVLAETIDFESVEDVWTYSYTDKRGEIVYISTRYTDSTSSVNVRILVDGKIYKQGSSINEPNKYITVSGTIPY
ncbi:MAG: hypothetical protein K8R74_09110 [Bacteroidales bacterium]|nr:hypothetical protein [Bacteroidales bacterium]